MSISFNVDEISILLRDYTSFKSQQWFGGKVQKIVSVSAAMASTFFNMSWNSMFTDEHAKYFGDAALFDSRVFQVPKEDVNNYFVWRQQDAVRNSIQSIGRKFFSHKQLDHKNVNDVQEMLWSEHNCNWNDYDTWKKRGSCIIPNPNVNPSVYSSATPFAPDFEIPTFSKEPEYINQHVYYGET